MNKVLGDKWDIIGFGLGFGFMERVQTEFGIFDSLMLVHFVDCIPPFLEKHLRQCSHRNETV